MRRNLRRAREQMNLTQQQMADAIGITLAGYQQLEYGTRLGSIKFWDALEDVTGIHQRLLREVEEPRTSQG